MCAVVVTYHPDAGLPLRIDRIAAQVPALLIVDNHSHSDCLPMLQSLADRPGVQLLRNETNLGVAAALNQAFCWAETHGYDWVITFDQDTLPALKMTEALRSVYADASPTVRIGIIGSTYIDPRTSDRIPAHRTTSLPAWREVKTVITSGSLMATATFREVGPFREDFFIDLVDIEYCLRLRAAGYKVLLALKEPMQHALGNTIVGQLLGKPTGSSNHSPLRRYYMMRNHVLVVRDYLTREPGWALRSMVSRIKTIILVCRFERDRASKIRMTLLGLWHGLIGRLDRVPGPR